MLRDDDLKALPNNGKPLNGFDDKDTAWQKVYEGLKTVANAWRKTFTPKEDFLRDFNVPEIRDAVNRIVDRKSTPAYELIGYFSQLDSADELTKSKRDRLTALLKKPRDTLI